VVHARPGGRPLSRERGAPGGHPLPLGRLAFCLGNGITGSVRWRGQYLARAQIVKENYEVAGGPAARAGLRALDVITAINGATVKTEPELLRTLRQHKPGEQVRVEYGRSGRRETATVTLGEFPTA